MADSPEKYDVLSMNGVLYRIGRIVNAGFAGWAKILFSNGGSNREGASCHRNQTGSRQAGMFQPGGRFELRFGGPLTGRAIKQDGVPLGLPDGRQLDAAGAIQTEIDAARLLSADQNPLGDVEGAAFQLILFAQGVMDVISKIVQVLNLQGISRHFLASSVEEVSGDDRDCGAGRMGSLG